MGNVTWIKISTNIFDDEKISVIEELPEHDTIIVIWFKLLSLAGKKNDSGLIYITRDIPYDPDKLSRVLRRDKKNIIMALDIFEKLEMIHFENDKIAISNWDKHQNVDGLLKIKEQTRARVAKHREKQKLLSSSVNVTLRNATEKNRTEKNRTEKNREEKNREEKKKVYTDLFLDLWAIYPNISGKKACSMKYESLIKRGVLATELKTSVLNYAKTVVNTEMKFVKQGKTFFGPGEYWKEFLIETDPDPKYTGPKTPPATFDKNYFKNKDDEYGKDI